MPDDSLPLSDTDRLQRLESVVRAYLENVDREPRASCTESLESARIWHAAAQQRLLAQMRALLPPGLTRLEQFKQYASRTP
jgi:hypothetical protein